MTASAKYMLDTTICIYIQRQNSPAVLSRFEKLKPGQAVISVITWGELLFGAAKSNKAKAVHGLLSEFVSLIPVEPMSPRCGKVYGQIRFELGKRGLPVVNNDLWIAAHAQALGLILITNNTREFERISGLKLENWS